MQYPKRYIPSILSLKDKFFQKKELNKSKKAYKYKRYYTRKPYCRRICNRYNNASK